METESSTLAGYHANLTRLKRFVAREDSGGYGFASIPDERLIPVINAQLIEAGKAAGKQVQEVFLDMESDVPELEQIRQFAATNQVLLICNLDDCIREGKSDFVLTLNFGRESLNRLSSLILFWISKPNYTLLSNEAVDLVSQRRFATVFFEEYPALNKPYPLLEQRVGELSFRETDKKGLLLSIQLLHQQLLEAEAQKFPRKRVFYDIVFSLATAYTNLEMHQEAYMLINKYRDIWENSEPRYLLRIAMMCKWGGNTFEAQSLAKKVLDMVASSIQDKINAYNELGNILYYERRGDEAADSYEKGIELARTLSDKEQLSTLLTNAANFYSDIDKWDIAKQYFRESLEICKAISKETGIAVNKIGIANVLNEEGKYEQAIQYVNDALLILKRITNRRHQSAALDVLGHIFFKKRNWKKSAKYFLESLELLKELDDKRGQVILHANMSILYEAQNKTEKANLHFNKAYQLQSELGLHILPPRT